ncbi:GNAT family N-acetyltransferase [Microlunatus soli]|uniref:FR47-like protein n=1 Tax=Microlunatus soli TaxID=630515 RepID=A0A1H1XSQ1_9ACTN|nr:GNAT family N-acetyltransferase [Microlunatus soli]SDT12061.1 FR47-like protein [Microlunatus soli]
MDSWGNPFWPTLRGALSHLAEGDERAVRFDPRVNIFAALPDSPGPDSWTALADLVGPGGTAVLCKTSPEVPVGWTVENQMYGVQYLSVRTPNLDEPDLDVAGRDDAGRDDAGRDNADLDNSGLSQIVELGPADVPEMAALTAATQPGPFLPRTIEQGGFIGIRDHGRLVSIGGYRCQLDDAVEISTVCTAPEARGKGHASRLIRALVRRIEASGRRAILHTGEDNAARGLYESLGFELVAKPVFTTVRADH